MTFPPLHRLADDLAAGRTTARALAEQALARIADASGEGGRTFISINEHTVIAAEAMDTLRAAGAAPSPFAGIPVSVKDLFDVAGEVTRAGSIVLADGPPAEADAAIVRRLRGAGFVLIGRTNMTEFAYSGVGLNPHYGTPASPWDRATRRVPGGSSSGAGVSVADGMAAAAIGTDTGGSVRIPAAFNGVTGFKPTVGRIPTNGCFPLSETLDSIGPLAPTVACCAALDAILAGGPPVVPVRLPLEGLRLAVPQTNVLDGLDETVSRTFAAALKRLSDAGARLVDAPFAALAGISPASPHARILMAEAYALHRTRLAEEGDRFDQRVRVRIERGAALSAADLVDTHRERDDIIARVAAEAASFDALVMPTVATIPPPIADLEVSDDTYGRANVLALRNTTVINYLGGCALTIPCNTPGEAPVGLMLAAMAGADSRIFSIGLAVESALGRAG